MKRIILLICIISLSACTPKEKENVEVSNSEIVNFDIIKKEKCNNNITKYYDRDNRNVYFVCLEEIKIRDNKETLSYYFNNSEKSFEESLKNLLNGLTNTEIYKDGGTKIFKNDKMTVITCNNMLEEGKYNQDIYFGDETFEFQDNFCTRET